MSIYTDGKKASELPASSTSLVTMKKTDGVNARSFHVTTFVLCYDSVAVSHSHQPVVPELTVPLKQWSDP
jgi:hypothetical protein